MPVFNFSLAFLVKKELHGLQEEFSGASQESKQKVKEGLKRKRKSLDRIIPVEYSFGRYHRFQHKSVSSSFLQSLAVDIRNEDVRSILTRSKEQVNKKPTPSKTLTPASPRRKSLRQRKRTNFYKPRNERVDVGPPRQFEAAMRELSDADEDEEPSPGEYWDKTNYNAIRGRVPWTQEEVKQLYEGVAMFGVGNWAAILKEFNFHRVRSSVSLKDKWRNIVRKKERESAME